MTVRGAAVLFLAAALLVPAARAQEPATRPAEPRPAPAGEATVSHRFRDVEYWVSLFDRPDRDAWQKPEELVKALHIAPGDRVADLGAGTGYFSRHLARAVGERGAVFAVDVEPDLIEYLRGRAEREKTPNVIPVLASFDNPRLPPGTVDLVLIVDTFHHIDDRLRYMAELKRVLSGRGRVAVVDFHKRELPVGPPLEHKLAKEAVLAEMAAAGYRLTEDLDDLLPYQYVLVFAP
jgi:ubiquinone/menaquinone biosynthesis C-methylase UbiE